MHPSMENSHELYKVLSRLFNGGSMRYEAEGLMSAPMAELVRAEIRGTRQIITTKNAPGKHPLSPPTPYCQVYYWPITSGPTISCPTKQGPQADE
jgi:hypothetical protein